METKAETFREFFTRRNGIPFPGYPHDMVHARIQRLGETLADWADELAKRAEPKS